MVYHWWFLLAHPLLDYALCYLCSRTISGRSPQFSLRCVLPFIVSCLNVMISIQFLLIILCLVFFTVLL
ncbi:hypothetical protein FKM82_016971 [Ascaphus truei]